MPRSRRQVLNGCLVTVQIRNKRLLLSLLWAYGVVVSMFDFHRSDRGSNPARGGKIS